MFTRAQLFDLAQRFVGTEEVACKPVEVGAHLWRCECGGVTWREVRPAEWERLRIPANDPELRKPC